MSPVTPLWPADLDHVQIDTPDPLALARFYEKALGMTAAPLPDGRVLLQGPQRRLVIGKGELRTQPYYAFALGSAEQLAAYRRHLDGRGIAMAPAMTPLFADNAFAVRDPDGRFAVFGTRAGVTATPGAGSLPGRLQHVVVASAHFAEMMAFYTDALGFLLSDTVHAEGSEGALGDVNVCFLRANIEHHSLAIFRAPQSAPDHHAYETEDWNGIKVWADHFAELDVPIWWGPGRHGAGNNLFFMVKDPDGNNIEISAELERMAPDQRGKRWASGKRAINLWGSAWIRDAAD